MIVGTTERVADGSASTRNARRKEVGQRSASAKLKMQPMMVVPTPVVLYWIELVPWPERMVAFSPYQLTVTPAGGGVASDVVAVWPTQAAPKPRRKSGTGLA